MKELHQTIRACIAHSLHKHQENSSFYLNTRCNPSVRSSSLFTFNNCTINQFDSRMTFEGNGLEKRKSKILSNCVLCTTRFDKIVVFKFPKIP